MMFFWLARLEKPTVSESTVVDPMHWTYSTKPNKSRF